MVTWPDAAGLAVRRGLLEPGEARFVRRFLAPGMVVVDVGAHGGFYSILARRRVGPTGFVVAFEPSPREQRRLKLNLAVNRFGDVHLVRSAVGEECGETDFYVVHGVETGFGGRQRPEVAGRIERLAVPLTTLDAALDLLGVAAVDLLKVDVEGGELAVLRGSARLLGTAPRPMVLCELSDARSAPWGHGGRAVYEHLAHLGFRWFNVEPSGSLTESALSETFHANLVAVPEERLEGVAELVHGE
jgi:FkbM family methyltransferase